MPLRLMIISWKECEFFPEVRRAPFELISPNNSVPAFWYVSAVVILVQGLLARGLK